MFTQTQSKDLSTDVVNNKREKYTFSFSGGLFDVTAKQDEVFERVAKPGKRLPLLIMF